MKLTIKEAIEKAVSAHKAGQLQDAEKLYKAILQAQPKHPDANHNLGVLTVNSGEVSKALPFFKTALESNPKVAQFWISCIGALIKIGDLQESKALLSEAKKQGINSVVLNRLANDIKIKKENTDPIKRALYLFNSGKITEAKKVLMGITVENPHEAHAYSILAKIEILNDNLDAAQKFLKAASDEDPDLPSIGWNKTRLFLKKNKFLKALEIAKATFRKAPNDVEGWVVLAECLRSNNKAKESLHFLNKAISENSEYAEAYAARGLASLSRSKHAEGYRDLERAFQLKPHLKQVWPSILSLRKKNKDYLGILNFFDIAIEHEPKNWDHVFQKGSVYQHINDLDEAVSCYKQVLKRQPNHAEAYNNLGNVLRAKGQLDEAIGSFCRAIEIKPDYSKAYYNKGNVLAEQFQFKAAIDSFNSALSINPGYGKALVEKLKLQAEICDWSELKGPSSTSSLLHDVKEVVSPFSTLALEDTPKRLKHRAELYSKSFYTRDKLLPRKIPSKPPPQLRIGYFSGDFHSHPVMFLIARLFEIHDRKHFEIFAYSYRSQENNKMKDRITRSVDHFKELNHLSDRDAAILAMNDEIDIAIDLSGYTKFGRPGILAYRVAPIQINYLGFPGTMGAEYIDYIIADSNLIPTKSQRYYSEAIIYLPNQYQPQDDTLEFADITPKKSCLGLPSKGFIFCALHTSYKINPEMFDVWMRLLKHTENSVLWLLDQNTWVKENLKKEAKNKEVSPDRLIFAKRVSHEAYLAQLKQADLFLDTFPYNAGATASNALWAGLPVITKIGHGYTARMAASLLKAMNLPELVTETSQEYENLAFSLAQNPNLLQELKIKVAHNRINTPLFDSSLFAKNIEQSYKLAYELYFKGSKPKSIRVAN